MYSLPGARRGMSCGGWGEGGLSSTLYPLRKGEANSRPMRGGSLAVGGELRELKNSVSQSQVTKAR